MKMTIAVKRRWLKANGIDVDKWTKDIFTAAVDMAKGGLVNQDHLKHHAAQHLRKVADDLEIVGWHPAM